MKKYSFPFHFCPLSTLTVLLSIFFVFPLHFLIRIEHCLVCNKNKIRVNRVYSQTVEINWISHLFPFSTAKRWPCGHIYFTCSSFKFRLSHFHTVENEMQMGYRARPLSTQETSHVRIHSFLLKKFLPNHFHATKVTPDVRPRERKKNLNASVPRIRTASGGGPLYLKALKTWLPSTRNEIDSDPCIGSL